MYTQALPAGIPTAASVGAHFPEVQEVSLTLRVGFDLLGGLAAACVQVGSRGCLNAEELGCSSAGGRCGCLPHVRVNVLCSKRIFYSYYQHPFIFV